MIISYDKLAELRPDINQKVDYSLKYLITDKFGGCPDCLTYGDLLRLIPIHFGFDIILHNTRNRYIAISLLDKANDQCITKYLSYDMHDRDYDVKIRYTFNQILLILPDPVI